jgi:hypothetical protein
MFTLEVLTRVYYYPPPPRSFGILGLGRNSRKIFGFKGLIRKIFRNKELSCQRALKMGLGQLRGPSWLTDTPRNCPNQISIVIVAHDRSYVNGFRSRISITDGCEERGNVPSVPGFRPRFSLHCSFAYSALASFRMGMSGSASFQRMRKSL